MRKAFTMVELIFVIVILGILASVAVPKLAATRDDAEVMTGIQKVNRIISDIGIYYTAHGVFGNVEEMTSEVLLRNDSSEFLGSLNGDTAYFANTAKTKKCFSMTIDDNNGTLNIVDLGDSSSFCLALAKQLKPVIKTHTFGGSNIYN